MKYRKVYNRELLWSARCDCCNYCNNASLNDETLIEVLGKKKKTRKMFFAEDEKIICEYCARPELQYHEVDNKTKTTLTQLGDLEKELAKWNNILKQEGFLDI